MPDIKERLDRLRHTMQEPQFLEGKGLSKEVNIRFFCYDPAEEMAVRHFLEQIVTDQSLKCHPIVYDLYEIFLKLCDQMEVTGDIPEMEAVDGREFLLEQIQGMFTDQDYVAMMQEEPRKPGDILVLSGVGDVFPFMRIHVLLEAMKENDIPVLVFYPGKFDGRYLTLFDRLPPNPYYRAFNEI